jgi:glycine oxidase
VRGYDVAVVGAGIAGAAVAWACASRGARVIVLERQLPATGASGAAAGMLAPCSEADGVGPFLDLGRESLALWPAFAGRLLGETGIDCELDTCGLLRLAVDEDDVSVLRERMSWQRAVGVGVEWLDADAVAADEPALARVAGAALYRSEGHVNSVRTVFALLSAAQRHGAAVQNGADVVGWLHGGGVRLSDGRSVSAGAVVLCAGAWTSILGAALGAPTVPIEPVRGELLRLRGVTPAPRRVLFGGRRGYALTRADGVTLVGATEVHAGFDARSTSAGEAWLAGVADQLLLGADGARVDGVRVGLRPRCPDGLPTLGRLDDRRGGGALFVATGHYRNGVLLAPVTADGMASIVLDEIVPPGWSAFDAHRHQVGLARAEAG